jgi:hypothetical protein
MRIPPIRAQFLDGDGPAMRCGGRQRDGGAAILAGRSPIGEQIDLPIAMASMI